MTVRVDQIDHEHRRSRGEYRPDQAALIAIAQRPSGASLTDVASSMTIAVTWPDGLYHGEMMRSVACSERAWEASPTPNGSSANSMTKLAATNAGTASDTPARACHAPAGARSGRELGSTRQAPADGVRLAPFIVICRRHASRLPVRVAAGQWACNPRGITAVQDFRRSGLHRSRPGSKHGTPNRASSSRRYCSRASFASLDVLTLMPTQRMAGLVSRPICRFRSMQRCRSGILKPG